MISVAADVGTFIDVEASLIEQAIRAVLAEERVGAGRVSVALVGDAQIRDLNRKYLGKDAVTDVIAFALHEPGAPVVGDVYVCFEQAHRQSQELGVPLDEELVRLTVHGVLHTLGYDHPDERREASPFFQRQEALVATLRSLETDRVV